MFSSNLPLFILGIGEAIGGFIYARILAAILGGFSVFFFYKFCRQISGSRQSALFSSIFLLVQAPHIFISKFATYDIVCLLFFTLFLWLASLNYLSNNNSLLLTLSIPIIFFLTLISKYIVVAFSPLIILIMLKLNYKKAIYFIIMLSVLILGYLYINREELLILYNREIIGTHSSNTDYYFIFDLAFQFSIIPLVLFIIGSFLRKKIRIKSGLIILLFFLAFTLVAYHFKSKDSISMFKHLVYTSLFLLPVAGMLIDYLYRIPKFSKYSAWLMLIIIAIMSMLSVYQVNQMQNSYPNTGKMIVFLKNNIDSNSRIISEDSYLTRYYLYPELDLKHFSDLEYYDNDLDGKYTDQDVIDGIWDGKFDFVILTGQIKPLLSEELRIGVLPNNYIRVYSERYEISKIMSQIQEGSIEIYKHK